MTLEDQTIKSIAKLARLEIAEETFSEYKNELGNIIDFVTQLETADTEEVECMTHPFDARLRLREDAVTEINQRDKYQEVAPKSERGLYLVPKVID